MPDLAYSIVLFPGFLLDINSFSNLSFTVLITYYGFSFLAWLFIGKTLMISVREPEREPERESIAKLLLDFANLAA